MSELNLAFPIYSRNTLLNSPHKISDALLRKGLCYITGYEGNFDQVYTEYSSLNLASDGSVKVLSPSVAKKNQPGIYSILFAPEFKPVKRHLFGFFYRDKIEIFCQNTGSSESPLSGELHFDKRYTFKSWYYLNDIGPNEGPMRVVPLDRCEEHSPIELRNQLGSRSLFRGKRNQHMASAKALEVLEPAAEYVTGPKGTLFFHITEAWHGASPVMTGAERKIIRGHSRALSDYFLK